MRFKDQFVMMLVALFLGLAGGASAADFETRVSVQFQIPGSVDLNTVNSTMQTQWFVEQDGGRTVYSNDVVIGTTKISGATYDISAHATWVINYDSKTKTVDLKVGKTHITNWLGGQRCHVYEDGTCNCGSNPNWQICGWNGYKASLVAYAITAALNAQFALEKEGYHVIRTP
jgi:hypothetical protein